MDFSEYQKHIINSIAEGKIKNLLGLILSWNLEKRLYLGNFRYISSILKQGADVFVVEEQDKAISDLIEFVSVLKFLDGEGLIYLTGENNPNTLTPLCINGSTGLSIFYPGILITYEIKDKVIIPSPYLKDFIKNNFLTKGELEKIEANNRFNTNLRNTRILAIGSIVITILGIFINLYFYSNERIVKISNPTKIPDSLKIELINQNVRDTVLFNDNANNANNVVDK